MESELIPTKITLYRQFLRRLSNGEIGQAEYNEMVDLISNAKSLDDLDKICEEFQIVPF